MLWEFVLFFDSGSSDTPPSYLSLCLFSINSDLLFLMPSLLPLCQHFHIFFPLETMIVGLMLDYLFMLFITHIQSVSSEFIFLMFHHAIASELEKYSQMQLFLSHILRWTKLLSWFICAVSGRWSSCFILLWGTS